MLCVTSKKSLETSSANRTRVVTVLLLPGQPLCVAAAAAAARHALLHEGVARTEFATRRSAGRRSGCTEESRGRGPQVDRKKEQNLVWKGDVNQSRVFHVGDAASKF